MINGGSSAKATACGVSIQKELSKNSRRRKSETSSRRQRPVTIALIDEFGSTVPFERFELSIVGVYLHSELVMYPGDELMLKIELIDSQRPLIVDGEVVSAETGNVGRGPGMGIAFRKLGKLEKLELKRFFARRFLDHGQR